MTRDQFEKCFPEAKDPQAWTDALNRFMPIYDVEHEAAFLAQCGHESQGFTRLSENLNYSATGLLQTWPTRFTAQTAQEYARQPEKIANKVYADRLGNLAEESGDGWKHRGAGCIQLTGKANHAAFAKAVGKSLEEATAYLHTLEGAVESACWYWQSKGLDRFATSIDLLTKRINGGLIGLADRKAVYAKVCDVLGKA